MADIAAVFCQFVQCMSPSIARRWRDHRDIYKNMENMKQRLESLICRKSDIESKLRTELVPGEMELRNEVKNWLERVEKTRNEVNNIEEKVRNVKFFCRSSLGKDVTEKIRELEELYSGGEFQEGLVILLSRRGNIVPTTLQVGGETTFKRKMEEILESLLDDEVGRIGVYGMGGIGKTTALQHIHNRLLEAQKGKFENLIWVNVSKDCSVMKLQEKIASKLDLDVAVYDDTETRAEKLYAKLKTKMRYVLILDDLWEPYFLKEVGIPEPTRENKCKLVVTTRSVDVCRIMSCKPIAMELLSTDEALNLFMDIVGRRVLSVPGLEAMVKEIVGECAGLPLAIVTTAGSLKDVYGFDEWETALEELKESTDPKSGDQVFGRLKFSYDRLGDEKLQECLLYCSLYPEDHRIERKELIELLVAEGIIKEGKTRKSEIRKGQVMLNKLVNVCLLIDATDSDDEKCVKMHDLVRDMALQITSDSPRFFVKAGVGLTSIPQTKDWKDNLAKVSLMDNNISDFPFNMRPPKCPTLSTLLLSKNIILRNIPKYFFLHMRELSVLDLSYTGIEELPESLSHLVNLTALFCRQCNSLRKVPPLGRLRNLRKLDFFLSGLEDVPQGLEKLVNLRYLNLNASKLKMIPNGILCKLVNLQYLSLNRSKNTTKVRAEELENLGKLETFEGLLYDVNSFIDCVQTVEQRRLTSYVLHLGGGYSSYWLLPISGVDKCVHLEKLEIGGSVVEGRSKFPLFLPKDIEMLWVRKCNKARTLCEVTSFENVTKLRFMWVHKCQNLEQVFFSSSNIFPILQTLEVLDLNGLPDLRRMIQFQRERGALSLAIPPGAFSSLKALRVENCPKIKKLFMIVSLQNLESVTLADCEQLEEIISTTYEDDNEHKDENTKGGFDPIDIFIVALPKLTDLVLEKLPKLKGTPIVANSLQYLYIKDCPKLKRLPFLDREPFPASIREIRTHSDTLESLEWDHPNAKAAVQSLITND